MATVEKTSIIGVPVRDALNNTYFVNVDLEVGHDERRRLDEIVNSVLVSPSGSECAFITDDTAWVMRAEMAFVYSLDDYIDLHCEVRPVRVGVYCLRRWMHEEGHQWKECDGVLP